MYLLKLEVNQCVRLGSREIELMRIMARAQIGARAIMSNQLSASALIFAISREPSHTHSLTSFININKQTNKKQKT